MPDCPCARATIRSAVIALPQSPSLRVEVKLTAKHPEGWGQMDCAVEEPDGVITPG